MKKVIIVVLFLICINLPSFADNQAFKTFYNLGLQEFKVKNYSKAVYDFNNALKSNPTSYQTYCMLGISYSSDGDFQNAEKILEQAIKLNPSKWSAYAFLADVKKAQKNYPVAIEYYLKAISLPSMSANSKVYYKKVIENVKQEQNNSNNQSSDINETKTSVDLNLDWQKWVKANEAGRNDNWIIEYGLKGQDVKNYKWTQLVTVQYYKGSEETSIDNYFKSHIATIEKMAQNTHNSFKETTISANSNEITYEWVYRNGRESEVSRIVKTDKGLYHMHFAKKGFITFNEKNIWLNIFKSAKITE